MAEIAPDPPGWLTALRFDIDTEGGGAAWIEAELPAPNLVVINPSNGHAHLIYLLGAWVQTDFGDSRRLKVVRYAAAIERAYSAALGADPAYTGRFQHNPLSDAYVTRIGRDAPYSLDELARYVDLNEPAQKKNPPTGIGRNVEIFDRLRRWAYVAVADWRIGTYEAWCGVVADRGGQIAADVGSESPRGPLKANEVGHLVKSVARWVWERYSADVPPLLREARIVAQREREKARQRAREAVRERSRVTRYEYIAPARQRRSAATEMRRAGLSLRTIAAALRCSLAEIQRVLITRVQGPPGLSDFNGVPASLSENTAVPTSPVDSPVAPSWDVLTSQLSGSCAVVSAVGDDDEHVPIACSAESSTSVDHDFGRGARGETNTGEPSVGYIKRRIREIVARLCDCERPP